MEKTVLISWLKYEPNDSFPIQNIPFGVCYFKERDVTHCCTRISNYVIDLAVLEQNGLLTSEAFNYDKANPVFNQSHLNKFIQLGRPAWKAVREKIQEIFKADSQYANDPLFANIVFDISKVQMVLPVQIGDYTDFYSSKNHAFNLGRILRGEKEALQPNWVHLPVGYHGRSSTIVVDGTPILRPRGQIKPPTQENPVFSECKRLDFEIEIGAIVGKSNQIGKNVKTTEADDYVFGLVLLNDWSARDIQAWEYVPLGPFNAKNFATTISPWIITAEALEAFKVELPKQDPQPLKYLQDKYIYSWDLPIYCSYKTKNGEESTISTTNYKYMYWSLNQQIAHHTVSGCKLNVGDVLGSGTISGTDPNSYGCLFEINQGGKNKLTIGKDERLWIEDGDYINFTAEAKGDGYVIGFGNCGGVILPANPEEDYY